MTIDYSKWSTVDDEEEDDGPAPSDDGRRPSPPSCAPAAAAAAANVSRQGFHDFVDAHKEERLQPLSMTTIHRSAPSSPRQCCSILSRPATYCSMPSTCKLQDRRAHPLEWPARCDKIVPNQILLCPTLLKFSLALRVEPACLQLALASLCSDTARSMPGCDPREAARQVFVRLRSEAPSGPYAEARKAFETHLASCVERVRQRASTELSSLRALEAAARGAISNGNGGTGSSRTSSCSAAADAPEHPPPPSSKSGCADGKCDTGQDDDSGGSAWARAAGCFVPSFVAGMLGSSCCLIQILLNSLAVGCAGFNKVLGGRVRGPLRLLSCVWLAVLWQRALVRRRGRRDAALSTLLCLGLTLPLARGAALQWQRPGDGPRARRVRAPGAPQSRGHGMRGVREPRARRD